MSRDNLAHDKKKKKETLANRRRSGFVLTQQRDTVPIVLGAAFAAVLSHVALFFFAPSLPFFDLTKDHVDARVHDEVITIHLQPRKDVQYTEAKDEPQEITETQELEEAIREPEVREIDILDYTVEELTMAPGETELAFPAPVEQGDAPGAVTEMPVSELDSSTLQEVSVPEEALRVAEPAPINANDVVVVSGPRTEDVEAATDLMDADLRSSASNGEGSLPEDTRSLAELMEVTNPGSESGVARLGADLLFNFNECHLTSSARFAMLQLAALIMKNPETNFVIEGHTDSYGSDEYNALLSLQRAAAVCRWLESNHVPMEHVYVRACGNKAPLADKNGSREAQSLNRRVEIHMRRQGEPLPEGCFPATYPVDLETPTATQIKNNVRVPETYTPSGTSAATDSPRTDTPATPAQPTPPKPATPSTGNKPSTSGGKTQSGGGKTQPKGGKSNSNKGKKQRSGRRR